MLGVPPPLSLGPLPPEGQAATGLRTPPRTPTPPPWTPQCSLGRRCVCVCSCKGGPLQGLQAGRAGPRRAGALPTLCPPPSYLLHRRHQRRRRRELSAPSGGKQDPRGAAVALVGASRVGALAGSDGGCGDGGPAVAATRESEAPRGTGQPRAPFGTGAPSNLPFFSVNLFLPGRGPWRQLPPSGQLPAGPRTPGCQAWRGRAGALSGGPAGKGWRGPGGGHEDLNAAL